MSLSVVEEVLALPILSNENPNWDINILEEKLLEAVKNCLPQKRPVSISLSGGVDSSLMTAMVRKIIGPKREIHTFTIARNEEHPDILYARIASKKFHTKHHEYFPGLQTIAWAIEQVRAIKRGKEIQKGNDAVFLFHAYISGYTKEIITCDGIDEIMGGYWDHCDPDNNFRGNQKAAFKYHWQKLKPHHLENLEIISNLCRVEVKLSYLQEDFVKYAITIPLKDRTDIDESKKPLRVLARKYGIPKEIIERKKLGFCDALDEINR